MLDALLAEARIRWGLDLAQGLQVIATERLIATPLDPTRPLVLAAAAVLGAPATIPSPATTVATGADDGPSETVRALPGRHGPRGQDPLAVLRRLYPADHPVGRFRIPDGTTIGALTEADLATPLYIGPADPVMAPAGPWTLPWLSDRLRAPDGCPWDREQTHASLRGHLLEETYEVYDALANGATPELADELGDLLLQVILHAQLAAEAGVFDLADVQAAISAKIVRRHPHVFGDAEARTASDVNRQWERIKAAERADADAADDAPGTKPVRGALDGIGSSLPALAASQEMQERAAHIGYDWPSIEGVIGKVHEELGELLAARTDAERSEELGDLLMVLVNVGRWHGIEAEAALRAANDKFRRRFREVERLAAEQGVALRDLDFAALDVLWDQAKALVAGQPPSAASLVEESAR
ncbi:MAG TPA: nucleoside triphosphate pyrophosphohydrolase [Candidatus Limnocylindrales bacterium]